MNLRILVFIVALVKAAIASAEDDTAELLRKATQQLTANGYTGDTSPAERYLRAILEREPDHLEARWQLIYIRLASLQNTPLSERAVALAGISSEFSRVAQRAKELKQMGWLHYVTAIHAGYYAAYHRALVEIDQALAVESGSVKYLAAKGKLLVAAGKWAHHDAEIEEGIKLLKRIRAQSGLEAADAIYDFYLAGAVSDLTAPRWEEVAEYYERFIEKSSPSTIYAFALNNVSIAYKHLGACDKAKDAADRALQVMQFGAAESNRRYAEFCLEMQKIGLLAKR